MPRFLALERKRYPDQCYYLPLISCYGGAETASLILSGPMKHLRIMRYVDEVARTGSIRKAADHLNVTSSAVNRRIMDLEEELGTLLFERRPRGVRLTAAGEVFVSYLREQNGDVDRMKSQIEDLKGMRRGTVRIACSQALALEFLPREIGEFRKRHPFVRLTSRCSTTNGR